MEKIDTKSENIEGWKEEVWDNGTMERGNKQNEGGSMREILSRIRKKRRLDQSTILRIEEFNLVLL